MNTCVMNMVTIKTQNNMFCVKVQCRTLIMIFWLFSVNMLTLMLVLDSCKILYLKVTQVVNHHYGKVSELNDVNIEDVKQ